MKKMTALACLLAMLISLTACAAASTPETTAAPEPAVTEAPPPRPLRHLQRLPFPSAWAL